MLLLRFFVLIFALFNVVSCWEDYENPLDRGDADIWSNNNTEDHDIITAASNGANYTAFRTNELALFSKKTDVDTHYYYMCIKFNPDTHQCNVSVFRWKKMYSSKFDGYDFIRKIDIAVPRANRYQMKEYYYDVPVFGFPFAYSIHDNSTAFKISLIGDPGTTANKISTSEFFVEDLEDQCGEYRPQRQEQLKGANVMSLSVYMIQKRDGYTTYPYFMIKNESNICVYRFNFSTFRKGTTVTADKFYIIRNYPTEGYAPKFFAIDPLYGTFVSIFWNGQNGSPPEAHFFSFNENEPQRIDKIDNFTLTGFDQDVLADIYSGNYDDDSLPKFLSFGRQIFVSFKRKGASEEFARLWKNETEFTPLNRPIDNFNKLWHVRKDYIQYWEPVNPYDESKEFNENVTSAPIINEKAFRGNPDSKEAGNGGVSNAGFGINPCLDAPTFWLFILFVLLDIVVLISYIVLVTFERRGAKKRNEAEARKPKNAQKKKHSKAAAAVSPATTTPKSKKSDKKAGKKNGKEKTSVTKSVDQESSIKSKKTTADQSSFYTVEATFEHGRKK